MNRVKYIFFSCLNLVIGALLSLVGVGHANANRVMVKYGVPSADITVKGKVVDEKKKPVRNVQVVVRENIRHQSDTLLTDNRGKFGVESLRTWPVDSLELIVVDPAQQVQSDSVKVPVRYKNNGKGFYRGTGKAKTTIRVKHNL